MRMSCAIPRASLRSVLTTIPDSAVLRWRVLQRHHVESGLGETRAQPLRQGPASSPMRVTGSPIT
jgi:hypothetical protein